MTGYQYAYADAEKTTPLYAYIAGDLAGAYVAGANLTRADRRMLAVYDTADASAPMYFFVFDDIASNSASYKKVFLLHTLNEPTINGKTVSTLHGDGGKLVLQNVYGGDNITKSAGCVVGNTNYAQDDGYWGRVEISPNTGSKENILLNVMYVCDNSNDPGLTATAISSSVVKGARRGLPELLRFGACRGRLAGRSGRRRRQRRDRDRRGRDLHLHGSRGNGDHASSGKRPVRSLESAPRERMAFVRLQSASVISAFTAPRAEIARGALFLSTRFCLDLRALFGSIQYF